MKENKNYQWYDKVYNEKLEVKMKNKYLQK